MATNMTSTTPAEHRDTSKDLSVFDESKPLVQQSETPQNVSKRGQRGWRRPGRGGGRSFSLSPYGTPVSNDLASAQSNTKPARIISQRLMGVEEDPPTVSNTPATPIPSQQQPEIPQVQLEAITEHIGNNVTAQVAKLFSTLESKLVNMIQSNDQATHARLTDVEALFEEGMKTPSRLHTSPTTTTSETDLFVEKENEGDDSSNPPAGNLSQNSTEQEDEGEDSHDGNEEKDDSSLSSQEHTQQPTPGGPPGGDGPPDDGGGDPDTGKKKKRKKKRKKGRGSLLVDPDGDEDKVIYSIDEGAGSPSRKRRNPALQALKDFAKSVYEESNIDQPIRETLSEEVYDLTMEQVERPVSLTELDSTSELYFNNHGVRIAQDYSLKLGGNPLPTTADTAARIRLKYVSRGTCKGGSSLSQDSRFRHRALIGALRNDDRETELKRLGDEISSDMEGKLYEPLKAVTSLTNAYNDDQQCLAKAILIVLKEIKELDDANPKPSLTGLGQVIKDVKELIQHTPMSYIPTSHVRLSKADMVLNIWYIGYEAGVIVQSLNNTTLCSKYLSAVSAFRSLSDPSFDVSIEDGASRIVAIVRGLIQQLERVLDSPRESRELTELAKLKTFYTVLRNLGPTNNAAINRVRDAIHDALLVNGKEIPEIVYGPNIDGLPPTQTVNFNGTNYEVYNHTYIVAMPPVVISPSVTLRTFDDCLIYVNQLEVSRDWCATSSSTMTPVKDIVESAGLSAHFSDARQTTSSRGRKTGNKSPGRNRTTITSTYNGPPKDKPAVDKFNSAKGIMLKKDAAGKPELSRQAAMSKLKSLNGSEQGAELKKLTGIAWESNGSYNLTKAKGLSDAAFRDKKLTPHTIAVFWLATKSYPKSMKKTAEQLHANMAKTSTPTDGPAESSSDEQKETSKPTATSQSTDNPKVDSDSASSSEQNDSFRVVHVKGASNALLVDGKMYTEGQLKAMLGSPVRSKRHSHRRSRGNHRKEPPEPVTSGDSGSSDDSNGSRSSRSSGRSSHSGRSGRRSRYGRDDSGH